MVIFFTRYFSLDNFNGLRTLFFFGLYMIFAAVQPHAAEAQINPDANNILYVDRVESGSDESGDSWENAIPELRDVLDWAANDWDGSNPPLQIWVAEGTYLPTGSSSDRNATFQLVNNVEIYGGFNGTETQLSERDWEANTTRLSGDIDQDSDLTGNSYSVVTGSGTDATAILDGFTISGGNADDQTSPFDDSNSSGGGMYNSAGSPSIVNSVFIENSANSRGGGIFNMDNSSPEIINSTITDNRSTNGGGIYSISSSPDLTNSTISNNSSGASGGGMFNIDSSPTVTNSSFTDNSSGFHGGGMLNNNSSPIVSNSSFTDNSSVQSGGGIYNQNSSSPEISGSTFTRNEANRDGGGIYNTGSTPEIVNSVFIDNLAFAEGGGIFNLASSSNITNSTFSTNRAALGGGMFNQVSSPVLTNNLFRGNRAFNLGGGILNDDSSPEITNNTFTENAADEGAGMYNIDNSAPVITNSILWNNAASDDETTPSASIFNDASTPVISYSLIANSGGSSGWNSDVGSDSGNNVDVNPEFADPAGGDFTLQNVSPPVNAGDPATDLSLFIGGPDNPEDLTGNPRVYDGTPNPDMIDMGAYEFQGDPLEPIAPDENNRLYVDQNVSGGTGSGSSWTNAIPELRDALTWAASEWDGSNPPLQIWVADGTYLPTDDGTDREASFTLVDQVEIYGGFDGGESSLDDRDWESYIVTLSGDIDQNDLAFEPQTDSDGDSSTPTQTDHIVGGNSYSVVYLKEDGVTALLDGFTVTGGLANVEPIGSSGFFESNLGGGMFIVSDGADIRVSNLIVEGNYGESGGGMFNAYIGEFFNIQFQHNEGETGGGLRSSVGRQDLKYENLIFRGNFAELGGGMAVDGTQTLVNALFVENSARNAGGLVIGPGNTTIIGSTFTRNSAEELAGAIRTARHASLVNVIIWDNELGGNKDIPEASFSSDRNIDISSSIIANSGGSINWRVSEYADDGGGNLDVDPIFADPENGDYSLSITSPAINRGDNTPFSSGEVAENVSTDLAGNPRIYDGDPDPNVVDMGAYEFQDEPFGYAFIVTPSQNATRIAVTPTFQWEEANLAEAYELQVSPFSDFSNPVIDQTGIPTTEYTPSEELRYGQTYYWRVRGTSSMLNGAWSQGQFQTTISNAGDGSETNPWEVATAEQLNAVRQDRDGYFIQTADIDLSEVTRENGDYWNEGQGWEPIGESGASFLGNYNGNGHIITGMFINRPERERTGLFGSVSTATIRGIGIVDPEITGGNQTGGLAGLFNNGTILESYVSGGSVNGGNQTGGLVGETSNNNTQIENVYAGTDVTGQDDVGGLIGEVTGTLNNAYAFSAVTGTSSDGALIGTGTPSGGSGWYFSTETGANDNGTGTGLDAGQMRTQGSFDGFDFTGTWQIQSTDFTSYPYPRLFTYDEPLTEPEVNPIPGLFIDDAAVVVLTS
ncbi:MAG: DUF5123 domain-containing protein, partial [Bacteroidetes bacterium]|nr:DUF5123 domain-containing protein [Bacteroidota bacterium]